jgi:hypothetical protein
MPKKKIKLDDLEDVTHSPTSDMLVLHPPKVFPEFDRNTVIYEGPGIHAILDDIRSILRDMKDGSGSLSAAMPADGGRIPVRVVSAPDPENEKLWERVFELTGLLEEWRRAPLFTDTEKYVAWLQAIGPRVDAAIEKVEQQAGGSNAERPAAKKGRGK